jgi:DNA-binding transcriptional LysR family regulator
MNLNLLNVFHAAAKEGSFTRAALELHLTQPGVSKHIKELERCYGTRLFDRVGKKVLITQAGEILYRTTGDIFKALSQAQARIDDLRGLATGILSIGSSITIGTHILPELLVEFREKHPDVELKLDIAPSRQTVDKVLDYTLEIGFIGHVEQDKRLMVTPLMTDQMLLIVSPKHEWRERTEPVHLQTLVDQTFLLPREGSGTRMVVDSLVEEAGVTLKKTMVLGTSEGVMHAVAAGLGVSILSEHMVRKSVAAGVIKAVRLEGIDLKRYLYLVRHKDRYLSEAAQAFLKLFPAIDFG